MKKLALAALLASTGLASAADLPLMPYKAVPVAPFSWTGFYFGGSAGGAWGHDTDGDALMVTRRGVTTTFASDSFSTSLPGFVSGVQAGYNMQLGSFLLGAEVDAYASTQHGTGSFTFAGKPLNGVTDSMTDNLNSFGTLRARGGWIMGNWLFYGTGGLAWQHMNWAETAAAPVPNNGLALALGQGSSTRFGWTAGAGAEVALSNNVLARLQYLYIDTGTLTGVTQITPNIAVNQGIHTGNNVLTLGLDYKL